MVLPVIAIVARAVLSSGAKVVGTVTKTAVKSITKSALKRTLSLKGGKTDFIERFNIARSSVSGGYHPKGMHTVGLMKGCAAMNVVMNLGSDFKSNSIRSIPKPKQPVAEISVLSMLSPKSSKTS